jgi:hypothetical protein
MDTSIDWKFEQQKDPKIVSILNAIKNKTKQPFNETCDDEEKKYIISSTTTV